MRKGSRLGALDVGDQLKQSGWFVFGVSEDQITFAADPASEMAMPMAVVKVHRFPFVGEAAAGFAKFRPGASGHCFQIHEYALAPLVVGDALYRLCDILFRRSHLV